MKNSTKNSTNQTSRFSSSDKKDVYELINDRIIAEMENGIIPWRMPWNLDNAMAISHVNGKPYSLLNQWLLGGKAGEYLTFNQVKAEGGHVKKGAKSHMVVFWKMLKTEKKDADGNVMTDEDGNVVYKLVPYLRYYQVFHIEDCEGIKAKYAKADSEISISVEEEELEAQAESLLMEYIKRENITLERALSGEAYYSPMEDKIHLPLRSQFESGAEYYSTAFHESIHSTGNAKRLDRHFEKHAAFGSEDYSREELVAEIGASYLVNRVGMETTASFKNNVAYIQNWLSVLRNDKKMIVFAAAAAEKAVKFFLNGKAKAESESSEETSED